MIAFTPWIGVPSNVSIDVSRWSGWEGRSTIKEINIRAKHTKRPKQKQKKTRERKIRNGDVRRAVWDLNGQSQTFDSSNWWNVQRRWWCLPWLFFFFQLVGVKEVTGVAQFGLRPQRLTDLIRFSDQAEWAPFEIILQRLLSSFKHLKHKQQHQLILLAIIQILHVP
jgi:hypothetical protein